MAIIVKDIEYIIPFKPPAVNNSSIATNPVSLTNPSKLAVKIWPKVAPWNVKASIIPNTIPIVMPGIAGTLNAIEIITAIGGINSNGEILNVEAKPPVS